MNDTIKSFINRDVITGVLCAASGAAISATAMSVIRRRKQLKAQEEVSRFEYVPDPTNAQPDLWAEGTSDTWVGTDGEVVEYVNLTKLYGPPGQFIGDALEDTIEVYTEVESAAVAEAHATVFDDLPPEEQDRLIEEVIAESSPDKDQELNDAMAEADVDDDEDEQHPNWGEAPPNMPDEGPAETEVTVHSVFAGSSGADQWDYDVEVPNRTPDQPYILHKDEYFAGERGFSQDSLIYYAGDDLVADTDNRLVPNHVRVLGDLKFGHGSGDSGLVFIRNEKLKADYEVALDPGTYQQVRYGIEYEGEPTELKHAFPRRFPRE